MTLHPNDADKYQKAQLLIHFCSSCLKALLTALRPVLSGRGAVRLIALHVFIIDLSFKNNVYFHCNAAVYIQHKLE